MTGSSPPSRLPSRGYRWRLVVLGVFTLVVLGLEPTSAFVMLGPLTSEATAVGLIVSAAMWYFALTHISARWLTRVFGRRRVLSAALVGWAVLEIGRADASSPTMLVFLGSQIGLCEGAVWPALAARLFSNTQRVSPHFPGGVQ